MPARGGAGAWGAGVEVVPLTVTVDGIAYLEGVDLDADAFYGRFQAARPAVSTAQPSPGRFAAAYEAVAEQGATEILSVHIGSSVSGTVNSARLASQVSPVPVRIVDTGTASFAISLCLWEAAEAAAAGAGIEQAAAAERVSATVGNVFVVGALDVARAGWRLADDVPGGAATAIPVLTLSGGGHAPGGRLHRRRAARRRHVRLRAGGRPRIAGGRRPVGRGQPSSPPSRTACAAPPRCASWCATGSGPAWAPTPDRARSARCSRRRPSPGDRAHRFGCAEFVSL